MPKLYCGRVDCKYSGKNNKCMAQIVNLNSWYGKTVYEGYQEFLICGTYEASEESKRIKDYISKVRGE